MARRYEVLTIGAIGDTGPGGLTLPNLKDLPPLGIPSDWLPPGFTPPPGVLVIPVPGSEKTAAPSLGVILGVGAGVVGVAALAYFLLRR